MKASRIEFDSNTSGASHRLIGESTQRKGLFLFPPATGNATLSNDPNVVVNNGIVLQLPQPYLYLTAELHGDIVQREWYVIYSGVAAPIGFIQVME